MKTLYLKSELLFALTWIVIYCVVQSASYTADDMIGIHYCASALFAITQTIVLACFLYKNNLFRKYGLCPPLSSAKYFLYYLPLLVLASNNLWNGLTLKYPLIELSCYICFMLCVGFLEELIFRGFLFKAIAKNNPARAVVVSSVTFGIGHILNSINGSGMDLTTNMLQIVTAVAFGFLFVTLFHRGKSLWSCIIAHAFINSSAAFSNKIGLTAEKQMLFLIIELAIIVAYILVLTRTLPKPQPVND